MSGLAKHKDIEELSEEAFYRIVGDYFCAKARIGEIDKVLEELEKSRNKLPKMEVFETYAEYLTVKQTHKAFDELTQPVILRLMEEMDDKNKLVGVLKGRLRELLPQGVWFRYGDQALKVDHPVRENYFSNFRTVKAVKETQFHLPPIIHIKPWKDVRPIPAAVTRTGKPKPGLVPSVILILSTVGAIVLPAFAIRDGELFTVPVLLIEAWLLCSFGYVGARYFAH